MRSIKDTLVRDSELRLLLIDGKIDEFNEKASDEAPNLENVSLRGIDLRGVDLSHANLRGAYMRNADIRGCDLFYADLEGASIHQARISGVRFPPSLFASEINMSLAHGTRMRCLRAPCPASASTSVGDADPSDEG